ncbi:MAG: G5 domain-containing protein [Abitibacteriaceae bacterium]|nr:G5 domain-containing protein [Abditibacteriaceae bacterium]
MVPTPAPKSCRQEMGQAVKQLENSNWLSTFRESSTQRTRKRFVGLTWMVVVCAIFPMGLWNHYEPTSDAAEVQQNEGQQNQVVKTDDAVKDVSNKRAKESVKTTQEVTVLQADAKLNHTQSDSKSDTTLTTSKSNSNTLNTASVATTPNTTATTSVQMAGRILSLHAVISGKARNANVMVPLTDVTVKEALAAMGVKLEKTDRTVPSGAAPAYDGMTIQVTRVRVELQKQHEYRAQDVRYKPTADLGRGAVQTVFEGKPRVIETTYRVWTVDGKVARREFISRQVSQEMQTKIIGLGAKARYVPSHIPYHSRYAQAFGLSARGGSPRDRMMGKAVPAPVAPPAPDTFRAVRCIELVATGYSPDPSENGGSTRTCTGLPIGYGAAAVDPRVVPLGTKMYVEGYGYAFACDTGGAIKGRRIDLAYDSYRVANSQGHRKVRVWILEP